MLATRGAVTAARVCLCAGTRVSTARVSALTRVSATRASGGRIAQNVSFRKKREWKLNCVSAVCEPGRWGPGCQRTCPCQHGATCDPVSGACTCAPGYHGPLCATRCDEGRYGLHCAETCRCQNGEWGIIWLFITPRSYSHISYIVNSILHLSCISYSPRVQEASVTTCRARVAVPRDGAEHCEYHHSSSLVPERSQQNRAGNKPSRSLQYMEKTPTCY